MAHQVYWIVQDRVLYIGQSAQVTLEDIRLSTYQVGDKLEAAYQAGSALIIGIVDLSEADLGGLIRSALAAAVKDISDVIDPRMWKAKPGFIILITTSEMAKTIIALVVRLSAQPMTTVGTLAEALTVASYMYPELQSELEAYRNTSSGAAGASVYE